MSLVSFSKSIELSLLRLTRSKVKNLDFNIALFDMDNTLVDYDGGLAEVYETIRGPQDIPIKSWHNAEDFPYIKNRLNLIKMVPGWWRNLKRYQPGFDILEVALEIGFEVHVLTKGPEAKSRAWMEKLEWCRAELPKGVKVTITEDKSLVYGKVLVDDYPPYLGKWFDRRPRGLGIIPVNDFNSEYWHPQLIRYDHTDLYSLDKVKKALETAYNREIRQELNI